MNEDLHDLVAPYALDALDDDERERFERHLAECEDCTEQLALLREPVAALAYAVEGPAPPEALRGRIIADARSEPRAVVIKLRRRNWPLAAGDGETPPGRQRLALDRERRTRPPRCLRAGQGAEHEDLRGLGDRREDAATGRSLPGWERLQPTSAHAARSERSDRRSDARAGRWSHRADVADSLQGGSDLRCPPPQRAPSRRRCSRHLGPNAAG